MTKRVKPMKDQLREKTKNSGAKQKVQHGIALKPSSSHRSCPFKSTKSREVLLNLPILTLFSSDIEIGERAAGKKQREAQNNREK